MFKETRDFTVSEGHGYPLVTNKTQPEFRSQFWLDYKSEL
jgi:hypothetical protein